MYMNKYLISFLLLLTFLNANSQEILLNQNINLDSGFSDKRDAYPIINKKTDALTLLLIDNYNINTQEYNNDYSLRRSYECPRPKNKYRHLIGHTTKANQYNLFFATKRNKEFLVQTINLDERSSNEKKFAFKLKDEKYLETFSYKNKLYILTLLKNSSILKLRVFEANSLRITKEFNFNNNRFNTHQFYKLNDVLKSPGSFSSSISIQKINNNNPNSLELTSEKNKVYCYSNKMVISLDHRKDFTILIKIDLEDLTSEIKTYKFDEVDGKQFSNIKSNSYIYQDILFQTKVSKYELYLSAYNLITDRLIKKYQVKKDENIAFKNTNLIQENDAAIFSSQTRVLETSKQILRKMASGDPGISVYETNGYWEVTLGGKKDVKQGGGMMIGGGMPMASASAGAVTFTVSTPTMHSFSSYTSTKSVYFKCLFNKDMQHIEGDVKKNPFDKIKTFSDDTYEDLSIETIFKRENYFVFGYYDSVTKKYTLRKFE